MPARVPALALCCLLLFTSGATVRTAAADTRLLAQPAVSATHVAFVYAGDLWSATLAGGDIRRLTTSQGDITNPSEVVACLERFNIDTIIHSVAKTGRLVLVENAHRVANATAEIAAEVAEKAFDSLKRPIVRVAALDVQVPFSPVLEATVYPTKEQIIRAVRGLS